jgi:tetratricopeptide (TPR) repeat protein
VHELSAEIFEVQNRYDDAVAEYQKAIDMNPQAPDLHFRLGRALLMAGHNAEALDKAATAFQSELKLNPEDGACEFQLGQIAQVQGKKPDAKAHFEKALALSPQFVQAMIALGKMETPENAIPLLVKAVQLQPANETAHYALLTAYRNGGQMDKAKEEKAILDKLQKPPEGEFTDFLKKLGEKPATAQ